MRHPRLHALLIGISNYDVAESGRAAKLDLQPLGSAALTVLRVKQWLTAFDGLGGRRMGWLRVMAAPSPSELRRKEDHEALEAMTASCRHAEVLTALEEWRHEASRHSGDLAFFYFAGHGLQREMRDHVLLLQDVAARGGPVIARALETKRLLEGMVVTNEFPNMARRQLYFFDACRMGLAQFKKLKNPRAWDPWDAAVPNNAQAAATTATAVHTATDGRESYGLDGKQSVFSDALFRCLYGSAAGYSMDYGPDGRPRWKVTLASLLAGLDRELEESNRVWGTAQTWDAEGPRDNFELRAVHPPPPVEISVQLDLDVAPSEAALELLDGNGNILTRVQPVDPNPYVFREIPPGRAIPSGIYTVRAWYDAAAPPCQSGWLVMPPGWTFVLSRTVVSRNEE